MKLIQDADLTHADARDMYYDYGYHLTTEAEGDVTLQAVEYDWLDLPDEEVVAKLREARPRLTEDEVDSLVSKAREVRDYAEEVERLLEGAVEVYQAGDLASTMEALDEAERAEIVHGDSPASSALRSQLIEQEVEV